MTAPAPSSPRPWRELLRPLGEPWRAARWPILGSIVAGWGKFFLPLALPWAAAGIIDRVIPMAQAGNQAGAMAEFLRYVGWCAAATALLAVCSGLRSYFAIRATATALHLMRRSLFDHVQRLSMAFFQRQHAGALGARVSGDLGSAVQFLDRGVIQYALDGVFFIVILAVVVSQHWVLALAVVVLVSLNAAVLLRFTPRLRRQQKALQEAASRLTGQAAEAFSGISLVKATAGEAAMHALYSQQSEHTLAMQHERARIEGWFAGLSFALLTVTGMIVLLFGSWIIIAGDARPGWIPELSIGSLVALNLYLASVTGTAQRMIDGMAPLQESVAALERLADLLAHHPDPADPPDALTPPVGGAIALRAVTFGYDPQRPVLRDLSLGFAPGRTYALVGASGSGKSTLCQLLLRFWDPQGGAVEVDGIDLRRIRQAWWRQHVAVVLQEPILFSTTVRENIDFAVDGATQADVERAARQAQIHDAIMALPQGYATRLGERGATLSGGQRQRVAIARALMRDPRLLILDEATSALDTTTERSIQDVIDRLRGTRTVVVIAHRLSTIRNADEILVMDAGAVVERGAWDELVARGGRFAAMVRSAERQPG